jgi:hypothetical protein
MKIHKFLRVAVIFAWLFIPIVDWNFVFADSQMDGTRDTILYIKSGATGTECNSWENTCEFLLPDGEQLIPTEPHIIQPHRARLNAGTAP